MNIYKYYSNPKELNGYNIRTQLIPQLAYNVLLSGVDDNRILYEECIAKSAYYSYMYAKHILHKKRFMLGEETIAKSSTYSRMYADDIIQGPFKMGEDAISKNAYESYWYARSVLHTRFELGEPIILDSDYKNPYLQFLRSHGIKL